MSKDNQSNLRPENDVNKLSNQQVVLLTVLVAIVSAVASALVVVQIFDQNPTQTVVNTVREVVTTAITNPATTTNTVVEKTYVIKEGDLVAKAVALNQNARVALMTGEGDGQSSFGWGLVISETEIISLDKGSTDDVFIDGGLALEAVARKDGFVLWETMAGSISQPALTAKERAVLNLGETIVLYSVTGQVKRGIVAEVGERSMVFSESLPTNTLAVLIDLSGNAIGLSNGESVILTDVLLESLSGDVISETEKQNLCESNNGLYLSEQGECEGISGDSCAVLGGSYDACASACRHQNDVDACIDVCVPVCEM